MGIRTVLCVTLAIVLLMPALASAQAPEVKTIQLSGTVVAVEGNQLVVKMANGEPHVFTPPPGRKFLIDGKELVLSQLKPGTKLNATVTETATPVTDRIVQNLSGTVYYATPPTVLLALPSGEVRKYVVKGTDPVKFYDRNKKEVTVYELRKGMEVQAEKITEAPRVEMSTTVAVTGTAPVEVAAPAPEPAAEPAAAPEQLPRTASPLPLVGLLGLLFTGASLAVRKFRD